MGRVNDAGADSRSGDVDPAAAIFLSQEFRLVVLLRAARAARHQH